MNAPGGRWHRLRVAARAWESANILSLKLVAAEGGAVPSWKPGQYLTFRVSDGGATTTRNYSISSDPADLSHWRISVKREVHGVGSGHMHDRVAVGEIIEAAGPSGQFVLRADSARPVILLAGGVGITPLMAMAQALVREDRRDVTLIHACQNAEVQPFRQELAELSARTSRLTVASCLAEPDANDQHGKPARFAGFVTAAVLRALLPIGDYEAYICGPAGFMQAMYDLLADLGVREENIAYEFFGPAKRLTRGGSTAAPILVAPTVAPPADAANIVVRFATSGLEARWDGSHRTLLEFAEAQGLQPAFSCRNGICMTCQCAIEGRVSYVEDPLDMPEDGHALLCCSVPDGPVTLEL